MIDRAFAAFDRPVETVVRSRSRDAKTIVYAGLDFRSLFIVVPRHELQSGKLCAGVVKAIDLGERLQPGLGTLLTHHAIGSPGCQGIIEPFIGSADCLVTLEWHSRVVKTCEIAHPVVGRGRHDPGIAAVAQNVAEASVVLKYKGGRIGERRTCGIPVDRVRQVDVEVGDDRLSLQRHVRLRGEVRLLQIKQIAYERLLRRTTRARIPLNRALIDHDREREARMKFSLGHHKLRGLIDVIVLTVPIDDHAIDAAGNHV